MYNENTRNKIAEIKLRRKRNFRFTRSIYSYSPSTYPVTVLLKKARSYKIRWRHIVKDNNLPEQIQ